MAARDLVPGTPVVVSIRPHEIEVAEVAGDKTPAGPSETNVLDGVLLRGSFLGDSVDYQVQVAGSDVVLRVVTPSRQRLLPGTAVRLRIAPAACIRLAD